MRLILPKLVRIVPNLVRIDLFPQFVCEIIQKKISRVFQIQVSTRIIRVGYLGQTMDLFRIEITQSYPYGQSSCNQPSHSFCAHIFPPGFFLSLSLSLLRFGAFCWFGTQLPPSETRKVTTSNLTTETKGLYNS